MKFEAEYSSNIAAGAKADADAVKQLRTELDKASGAMRSSAAAGSSTGSRAAAGGSPWAGPLRVNQDAPEIYRALGALKQERDAQAKQKKRGDALSRVKQAAGGGVGTVAGGARMAVGAAAAAGGIAGVASLAQLALGYQGVARIQALIFRTQMQARMMFRGVDSGPAVRAVDRFLGSIFSQSSVAGRALGGALTRGANGFFAFLERSQPVATAFFQGILLGGLYAESAFLRARLALLPYTSAIESAIGPTDAINGAAAAGLVTFGVLAVAVGGVAGAFVAAGAAIGLVIDQWVKLKREWGAWKEGAGLIGKQMRRDLGLLSPEDEANATDDKTRRGFDSKGEQQSAVKRREEWMKANGLGSASGEAYAQGVIKGTTGGASAAAAAGGALADSVDRGFRDKAQIKSPSKVAERRGEMIPAGVARGVVKGTPQVEAAGAAMMPSLGGGPGAPASPDAGSRSVALAITVQVQGAKDASDEGVIRQVARAVFGEETRAAFAALGLSVQPGAT